MQRRRFLQVTAASIAGVGLGACGDDDAASAVPAGGLALGTVDEVQAAIEAEGGSWYVAEAKAYVVPVPEEHRPALVEALADSLRPGIEAGFVALGQKCPHQGCRVPYCAESGWFECPCHGSRFSPFGELRRGPANRGMTYLPLGVDGDGLRLLPDAVEGIEDDVTGVEPAGAHCV